MANNKKLVICECNILGSPTSELLREKFSDAFGIKWKGWYGKYFSSLSEQNHELPLWIIEHYKSEHKNWNFTKPGIIFFNPAGDVLVLENGNELNSEFPIIQSQSEFQKKYSLAQNCELNLWFEVIEAADSTTTQATIVINTTAKGDSLLASHSLHKENPLIVSYNNRMYYIAADFTHGDLFYPLSYLGTVNKWGKFLTNLNNKNQFFWNYYQPFISGLMNEYYKQTLNEHN